MAGLVSIKSTDILVFVEFHSLEEIVKVKWIHVYQINVEMGPNAHPVQIIKTFHALAREALLEDFAMKTSTNASYQHLAEMERLARILTDHTNVYVLKDTKDEIVLSTPTIVPHSLVKTEAVAEMELEITLVYVWTDLKANSVKLILTSALLCPAKMEPLATNMLIHILAHVVLVSRA